MADQTLVFWHGDAGRTDLTLDIVHPTTFAVVASGLALSDDPSGGLTIRQRYIHTRTGVTTSGRHIARIYEGGALGPNSPHIVDLLDATGTYKLGWAGTLDWLADYLAGLTLSAAERNAIADAHLDRANAIDGKTPRQYMQITGAVVAGQISGAGTGIEVFLGLDGLTIRATVTVNDDGNRISVVYA